MTIILSIIAARFNSVILAVLTGISLVLLGISSHNYLHQKDNWRMFCLNLSGFNYREWRISHAMSHHMFPNTIYDLEVTNFEPMMQYIPKDKTESQKLISILITPIIWIILVKATLLRRSEKFYRFFFYFWIHFAFNFRTLSYFHTKESFKLDHLLSFALPALMFLLGNSDIISVTKIWLITISVTSFLMGFIGTTSGHHHPKVYHEGDELPWVSLIASK